MTMAYDDFFKSGMLGSGFGLGALIAGGYQQRDAANLAAEGIDIAGGQYVAASQRSAQEQERKTKLLTSRAQAVAAASGAGGSDPTVVDIISNIAGEGAYRSMIALYEGKEAQRAAAAKADAARYAGKSAVTEGYIKGIAGVGRTFFDKYGGGGPTARADTNYGWDTTDYGSGSAYNLYGAGP